jgi:hypothetical protein
MLEFIFGIIIGAAFADFWKDLYLQGKKALTDFMNKSSS